MNCSNGEDRLVYIDYTLITTTLDETRVAVATPNNANWAGRLTWPGTALARVHPLLHDLEPYRLLEAELRIAMALTSMASPTDINTNILTSARRDAIQQG